MAAVYLVPAQGGVDQNGYLVGGRQIAETGTMKLAPRTPGTGTFDPHQFVGRMWVGADYGKPTERFYPKYPIGYPLLIAAALKIGGPSAGPILAYWINPVAMTLGLLATFLLGRMILGSFMAFLMMLAVATSPVTLQLTNNPNSHATAFCFVAWGMYFLIAWWQWPAWWRAALAGFLLGYAPTIRYTEATLILPILIVLLFSCRRVKKDAPALPSSDSPANKGLHPILQGLLMLLMWAIPVGFLLIYNRMAMGTWTGYDPTNESRGFAWSYAADNWETMFRQLTTSGLFILFPFALAGLIWMFRWSRRFALVMSAWIVPCLVAYTFYYWAPDGTNIGYLRFFLTIFPALAICAGWMLLRLIEAAPIGHTSPAGLADAKHSPSSGPKIWGGAGVLLIGAITGWLFYHYLWHDFNVGGLVALCALVALVAATLFYGRGIVAQIGTGLLIAIAVAVQAHGAVPALARDQAQRLTLNFNTHQILNTVPAGSVVFFSDRSMLHHLQFVRDYILYDGQTFSQSANRRLIARIDTDDPQTLDPYRREALYDRLKDLDQKQLDADERNIVLAALKDNKRVFIIEPPARRRGRDNQPRPMTPLVGKLIADPLRQAGPLYADVVSEWDVDLSSGIEDFRGRRIRGPRIAMRARGRLDRSTRESSGWRIDEVSLNPLPISKDRQALIDAQAHEKAVAQKKEADRAVKIKARQEKREAEQAAAEKARQERLAAQKAAAHQAAQARAAVLKQLNEKLAAAQTDVRAAQAKRTILEKSLQQARQQTESLRKQLETLQAESLTAEKAPGHPPAADQSKPPPTTAPTQTPVAVQ